MKSLNLETRVNIRRWFRENRINLFYTILILSSFLTLLSPQGFFNLFFYAILVIVIVRMNEDQYANLHLPSYEEIIVGILICVGSFGFDFATRGIFGGGYGQTDYTILVVGLILLFFGYRNIKKIYMPILLVGGLSFSLKALQLIYESHFDSIANWFVAAITGIAGPGGLGYPVYSGVAPASYIPGTLTSEGLLHSPGVFTVFGLNEIGSLEVEWGCTGLRSLVMFSFILVALVYPMDISWKKKTIGISLGILGAFIINILRMVMLALIMYYKDMDTMMQVHLHLGDFLFIAWIGVYWWVFFRFFSQEEYEEEETEEAVQA